MKRALVVVALAASMVSASSCGKGSDGSTNPAAKASLTVSISGNGHVISQPAGIDCTANNGATSGTCTAQFLADSRVILQAAAGNDQFFSQWTGACSGAQTCEVSLAGAQAVAAAFAVVQRTVQLRLGTPNADDGIVMMTFTGPSAVVIRPRTGVEIVAREVTLSSGQLQTTFLASGAIASGVLGEIDVRGGPAAGSVIGEVTQAAAQASGNYARRTLLAGYSALLTPQ